jgi:hypothetical protein
MNRQVTNLLFLYLNWNYSVSINSHQKSGGKVAKVSKMGKTRKECKIKYTKIKQNNT